MKAVISYLRENNGALQIVKDVLEKHDINFKAVERSRLKKRIFKKADLVIAIGGDGTFLRTSHYVLNNVPVMGVNSDPKSKEGFFTCTDKKGFERKFAKFLKGKHKTVELTRLQAVIGRRRIKDPALNEVYIGPSAPYKTARYWLVFGGRKEYQKSSGILAGTASGSHAWIKSCGVKVLPRDSKVIQFAVREPFHGKIIKCRTKKGVVKRKLEIISDMFDGILIIDSLSKKHKVKRGKKIVIEKSKYPLVVVV